MVEKKTLISKLLSEHEQGLLVTFSAPGHPDFLMSVSRSMVDEAMAYFEGVGRGERRHLMRSVVHNLMVDGPKVMSGKASQSIADGYASDCAIWLAHELLYADGERHLAKPLPLDEILQDATPNTQRQSEVGK